jgi:chromosome partitioning protein
LEDDSGTQEESSSAPEPVIEDFVAEVAEVAEVEILVTVVELEGAEASLGSPNLTVDQPEPEPVIEGFVAEIAEVEIPVTVVELEGAEASLGSPNLTVDQPEPEPEPEVAVAPEPEPEVAVPETVARTVIVTAPPEPAVEAPIAEPRHRAGRGDREAQVSGSLRDIPQSNGSSLLKPRPLPRVIAIANQKGGVGKTTTTVNLGAALSELSYRVLVIDLDPQGNATSGLGIDTRNFESSMYDVVMRDAPIEDCIEPTNVQNLFLTPATIDLAGVEIELVSAFSRELKLKKAIDSVVDDFDFVLIDCPPSLGLLTVNGLAAATEVLVPIQCEYYALEGLSQLLRNVALVASNLNEGLEVSTIVLTMYDARTRLAVDVADEVREHFKDRVCRSIIPRTVRLSEAPSFGQPITVFDPSSRGAVAYRELAKEVSNGAPKRSG